MPLSWIAAHNLTAGSSLPVGNLADMAEMGRLQIWNRNRIIDYGLSNYCCWARRVVLTTVSHLNDYVFHLTLTAIQGNANSRAIRQFLARRMSVDANPTSESPKIRGVAMLPVITAFTRRIEAGSLRINCSTVNW